MAGLCGDLAMWKSRCGAVSMNGICERSADSCLSWGVGIDPDGGGKPSVAPPHVNITFFSPFCVRGLIAMTRIGLCLRDCALVEGDERASGSRPIQRKSPADGRETSGEWWFDCRGLSRRFYYLLSTICSVVCARCDAMRCDGMEYLWISRHNPGMAAMQWVSGNIRRTNRIGAMLMMVMVVDWGKGWSAKRDEMLFEYALEQGMQEG